MRIFPEIIWKIIEMFLIPIIAEIQNIYTIAEMLGMPEIVGI